MELILKSCSDYWTGEKLEPIDEPVAKKILEFFQNAIVNDMQVVAYSYKPFLNHESNADSKEIALESGQLQLLTESSDFDRAYLESMRQQTLLGMSSLVYKPKPVCHFFGDLLILCVCVCVCVYFFKFLTLDLISERH